MGSLRNVVYLSEVQYATIVGGTPVGGISYSADDLYLTPGSNLVDGPATSIATGIATFADANGSLLTSPNATVTPAGVISATGFKAPAGAYNAPSYTFSSDLDTGI